MSSNPFRKKGAGGGDTAVFPPSEGLDRPETRFPALDPIDTFQAPQAPTQAPMTSFRSASSPPSTEPPVDTDGQSTQPKKPKVVKKVRVLSPPPLSPDSPEYPFHQPPIALSQTSQQYGLPDPFYSATSSAAEEESSNDEYARAPPAQPSAPAQPVGLGVVQGPPMNPFDRTLQDLEGGKKDEIKETELAKHGQEEGAVLKAANAARGSLNVDSFHRLLMTGNAGAEDGSKRPEPSASTEQVALVDAITAVNATVPSQTQPDTHEAAQKLRANAQHDDDLSDSSISVQVGNRGKKAPPPPPSSRHGKSLRIDVGQRDSATASPAVLSPGVGGKPLPVPPGQDDTDDDDAESPFDRAAAGRIPEPGHALSSHSETPSSARRSVPAPPPPRGHSRTESKAYTTPTSSSADRSAESPHPTLARAETMRQTQHAPAPPPPRRAQTGKIPAPAPSLTSSSFTASGSSASTPSLAEPEHHPPLPDEAPPPPPLAKPSGPPPPPARSRRPLSIIGNVDSSGRRTSSEHKSRDGSAQKPPVPRPRGSSRSSLEGPPKRSSIDSISKLQAPSADEAALAATLQQQQDLIDSGKGMDILADLDALQREVDALRGKIN